RPSSVCSRAPPTSWLKLKPPAPSPRKIVRVAVVRLDEAKSRFPSPSQSPEATHRGPRAAAIALGAANVRSPLEWTKYAADAPSPAKRSSKPSPSKSPARVKEVEDPTRRGTTCQTARSGV